MPTEKTMEIRLRVPPALHKKIAKSAKDRKRSVHSEALTLLDEALSYNEDFEAQAITIRMARPGKLQFKTPSISTDGIVTED